MHGQGRPKDAREKLLLEYLRRVAAGLRGALGKERFPIVLAGVDYVQAMFRKVFHHPYLLDDGVSGSPDSMDSREVWEKSRALVREWNERTVELASRRYNELAKTERTTDRFEAIVSAAVEGRVDTLFLRDGLRVWGAHDASSGTVREHEQRKDGDVELTQLALERTLGHDGDVLVLDRERVPSDEPACAILRW